MKDIIPFKGKKFHLVVESIGHGKNLSVRDRFGLRQQIDIPNELAPQVAAAIWPEGAAVLRAILTAAEIKPTDVFEGPDDLPVYDDAAWFTLRLLEQIRAAVAQLEPPAEEG